MENNDKIDLPKVIYPVWGVILMIVMLVLFVVILKNIDVYIYEEGDNCKHEISLWNYILQNILRCNN